MKKEVIKDISLHCSYCQYGFNFRQHYRQIEEFNRTELRTPRCPRCRNLLPIPE